MKRLNWINKKMGCPIIGQPIFLSFRRAQLHESSNIHLYLDRGTANISEILYAKQNIDERIHRIICQRINIYSKYQSPTV
ncbi:hypothetical protein, partial [Oceanobacillus massiliensis]|uniref:hypothetical protein n=1 Tax=Oceanobacillus massiliensis TaxID=1465765 RepID=UPI003017F4C3